MRPIWKMAALKKKKQCAQLKMPNFQDTSQGNADTHMPVTVPHNLGRALAEKGYESGCVLPQPSPGNPKTTPPPVQTARVLSREEREEMCSEYLDVADIVRETLERLQADAKKVGEEEAKKGEAKKAFGSPSLASLTTLVYGTMTRGLFSAFGVRDIRKFAYDPSSEWEYVYSFFLAKNSFHHQTTRRCIRRYAFWRCLAFSRGRFPPLDFRFELSTKSSCANFFWFW